MTCTGLLHGMCRQNLTCSKCGRMICLYCRELKKDRIVCPGCAS